MRTLCVGVSINILHREILGRIEVPIDVGDIIG